MDYFVSKYIEACTVECLRYGFKRKNKTFVRVINDVMQNFMLEKLRSHRAYRVEFAVIPLCLRIEKAYILGGVYSYNLRKFELAPLEQWDQWDYDPKSEKSMGICVNEVVRYLTSYLLPFFERANSCETALAELMEVESLFNANRLERLKINGIEDKANPKDVLFLFDNVKYHIALKNGDLDFAIKSRRALLEQNVDSYNSMSDMGYLTEKDRVRREKSIAELKDEINRLERRDESYIRKLIIENEAYSLGSIKDVIKSI